MESESQQMQAADESKLDEMDTNNNGEDGDDSSDTSNEPLSSNSSSDDSPSSPEGDESLKQHKSPNSSLSSLSIDSIGNPQRPYESVVHRLPNQTLPTIIASCSGHHPALTSSMRESSVKVKEATLDDSDTRSTKTEDNIPPAEPFTGLRLPTDHRSSQDTGHLTNITKWNRIKRLAIGRSWIVYRFTLIMLVVAALVSCFIRTPASVKEEVTFSDVITFKPYESKTIELDLENETISFFLVVRPVTNISPSLVRRPNSNNETLLTTNVTSPAYCTNNTNVTWLAINKWADNSNLVRISCWLQADRKGPEKVNLTVTNEVDATLGLLIDIDDDSQSLVYLISVVTIIIVLHILLFMSDVRSSFPLICLAALLGAVLKQHFYQGYDLGTIQSVASLSKGSLLDQSLQIGSMMLLSNVLKISGFYVRLSRMMIPGGGVCGPTLLLMVVTLVLSFFLNRVVVVIGLVPLAISVSWRLRANSVKLALLVLVAANVGNIGLPIGSDALYRFDTTEQMDTSMWIVLSIAGVVCSLSMVLIAYFCYMSDNRLIEEEETQALLDKSYMNSVYKSVASQQDFLGPADQKIKDQLLAEMSDDCSNSDLHLSDCAIDLSQRQTLLIGAATIITLLLIKVVEYLPFHSYWKDSVDSVSPGLLYLACALCLYIALGCRDEYISKVDFSLIVMVVSYQFLMQTLLTVPMLEWISGLCNYISFQLVGCSGSNLGALAAVPLLTSLSSVVSALTGIESFSPDMLNASAEMFQTYNRYCGSSKFSTLVLQCQVIGSTLGGNLLLFGSISNIVGVSILERRQRTVAQAQFWRLSLPVAVVTIILATAILVIDAIHITSS